MPRAPIGTQIRLDAGHDVARRLIVRQVVGVSGAQIDAGITLGPTPGDVDGHAELDEQIGDTRTAVGHTDLFHELHGEDGRPLLRRRFSHAVLLVLVLAQRLAR